ncbi:hypothetical protein IC582_029192 [Cucumis melo]|uniref:Receptor-like protein EIX2 n=1 Tax=Cucumis melo TaxID=3656 RepID=A0A1S3BB21_CUCME|nr:receptor-like protein EIX2 [Cucumis melo]
MGKMMNSTTFVTLFFIVIMFGYSLQLSTGLCIKQERESLVRLKASFIDSSNRLGSWKGTDCCSWEGVGCDRANGGHVVKLDLRNYEYFYSSALLSNGVDSSLFELKYLNYLDLSGNFFNYTQIPNSFAELLELTYLNLSSTYFHGTIQPFPGNLTKLLVLDFNNEENLNGPDYFPLGELFIDGLALRWVSGLLCLEYLHLSGVRVVQSGKLGVDYLIQLLNTVPSLLSLKLSSCALQNDLLLYAPLNSSFLSKLQHLDLSYNEFDGPIPIILQNMTSLKYLNLNGNLYNSSIPSWLSNLRNLDTLSLGSNSFSSIEGGFPSMVRNNCHLKSLDLSFNHFVGEDVFGSYENLSSGCKEYGLQRLYLERMIRFGTHTIPSWLGELKNLKSLSLRENALYGPIPSSFGNLSSLEDLDISYNRLRGGIPISFGQLRNLNSLDVSKNSLKGVITETHFANLSQLKMVAMSSNEHLSFEIKHDWVPPFQLQYFSVRSTKGFGSNGFPRWLVTQKDELVLYLVLSNTSLSGPIPTWLSFPNFIYLDISNNQISGPLPYNIGYQIPNMFAFYISNNMHINGSLPPSVCKWRHLMLLGLSNNELSGTIPSCLVTPNLTVFDLSSNKFSGFFPTNSFDNITTLKLVNLANNKLEGEPLVALSSCTSLSILDLQGNQFSGSIPSWMGRSLQSLQILNLQGNSFNGTIPLSIWILPRLQILILADNKLEGEIPPIGAKFATKVEQLTYIVCNPEENEFAICYVSYISQVMKSINLKYSYLQLYSMVNVDLSNNNLQGHIPRGIVTINGLFALNLSHNNLTGSIPVEIGRSLTLESLDLSSNQLSGSIPLNMANLNSLGALNLSNNNFSGRIPREGHLSTFNNASSYEGNPYLCGDPLFVTCPNEDPSDNFHGNDNHEEDKLEKMWFCVIVMAGYALGFWGVVGTLILKKSWRHAYFRFMDETKDKISVAILVNMATMK